MPETDSLNYVREHIALGTGWTFMLAHEMKYWTDPAGHYRGGGTYDPLPNFVGSLEAIQEAVMSLPAHKFQEWKDALIEICFEQETEPFIATAHQRALALYKILP